MRFLKTIFKFFILPALLLFSVILYKRDDSLIIPELNVHARAIAKYYNANNLTIVGFYNKKGGDKLKGLDYSHLYCASEYAEKPFQYTCPWMTEQPTVIYGNFMKKFEESEDGIYKIPFYETEGDASVKSLMKFFSLKSMYSRYVFDESGKPIGAIVMSYDDDTVNIQNFDYFNEVIDTKISPILLKKSKI